MQSLGSSKSSVGFVAQLQNNLGVLYSKYLALVHAGRGRDANPLAHVLQAIGEPLECKQYNTWNVVVPEGQFLTRVSDGWSRVQQVVS
jgi:hypothetical protein